MQGALQDAERGLAMTNMTVVDRQIKVEAARAAKEATDADQPVSMLGLHQLAQVRPCMHAGLLPAQHEGLLCWWMGSAVGRDNHRVQQASGQHGAAWSVCIFRSACRTREVLSSKRVQAAAPSSMFVGNVIIPIILVDS